MKKLVFAGILVLFFTTCSDDDPQDGLSDYRAIFSPDTKFFSITDTNIESDHLMKGNWTGSSAFSNGTIMEFPLLEIGDTLGRLSVLNSWKKPNESIEYKLIQSIPPGAVRVDPKSGYVILNDPYGLVYPNNSFLEVETETKMGNRIMPFKLKLGVEELKAEWVIASQAYDLYHFMPTYPYLQTGYEVYTVKVTPIFGQVTYTISPSEMGLRIDPISGMISVDNPQLLDFNKIKSLSYVVNSQVSHPMVEKKWNREFPGKITLTNLNSAACSSGNGFLFSATDRGENLVINKPADGTELVKHAGEYQSDEYSFMLSQPKVLCAVSVWDDSFYTDEYSDSHFIIELLDKNNETLMTSRTGGPNVIDHVEGGFGDYMVFNPKLTAPMPVQLEANKRYTIKRVHSSIPDLIDEPNYSYEYAGHAQNIEFPLIYGGTTILGAKHIDRFNQKLDLNGIPLIDLNFAK